MTLTVTQAQRMFVESLGNPGESSRLDTLNVPLLSARQRICACDVIAQSYVPPNDNSAMDGFAVRASDLGPDTTELLVSDRIPAGSGQHTLQAGTAARIFTGGPMPHGADAVVIQENCQYQIGGDRVIVNKAVDAGANVRPKGQDISPGKVLVSQGRRLNAVDLSLLASVGLTEVEVFRALRVAIFSTGDELAEPGEPLKDGQIYNSNRTMLIALCQQLGCDIVDCGIVEDTLEGTKQALARAAEQADLVISSGGVSVGEEDHIRPAVEQLGELTHWKVQMKPGKPVVFGRIENTPFLGLPGNPVSSFIVFQLLGVPVMRCLQGCTTGVGKAFAVKSGFNKAPVSREEYIRARLIQNERGELQAELFDNQSSGVLFSLAWADGLVRQNVGQEIAEQGIIEFLPLRDGLL